MGDGRQTEAEALFDAMRAVAKERHNYSGSVPTNTHVVGDILGRLDGEGWRLTRPAAPSLVSGEGDAVAEPRQGEAWSREEVAHAHHLTIGAVPDFEMRELMDYVARLVAAPAGEGDEALSKMRAERDDARALAQRLAAVLHGTVKPSKLHDPEHLEWSECPTLLCRAAAALCDPASEKPLAGEGGEGELRIAARAAAHHLRNLPGTIEGDDMKIAEHLERGLALASLAAAEVPVSVSTGGHERAAFDELCAAVAEDAADTLNRERGDYAAHSSIMDAIHAAQDERNAAPVPSTGGEGQALAKLRAWVEGQIESLSDQPAAHDWRSDSYLRGHIVTLRRVLDEIDDPAPASASVPEDAEGHRAHGEWFDLPDGATAHVLSEEPITDPEDRAAIEAVIGAAHARMVPVPGVDAEGERRVHGLTLPEFIKRVDPFVAESLATAIFDGLGPAPVSPVTEDEAETPAVWCDTCGTRLDSAHPGDSCDGWLTGSCPGTFRPAPDASQED